uniref:ABC transporter domain-containing protein n=1 Tax=Pseudo-nitzschia australis TaxID=44445 RepID=A0A7S4AKX4_9STRA
MKRSTTQLAKIGSAVSVSTNANANAKMNARTRSYGDAIDFHHCSKQQNDDDVNVDKDKDGVVLSSSSTFIFQRRRIRTFATTTMTTVLWFQMVVLLLLLLLLLPPGVVGAVGGEGLGRIKPPPPPPRTFKSSSVEATSTATAAAASSGTKRKSTTEERDEISIGKGLGETTLAIAKQIQNKNSNTIPPPPPPTRVVTSIGEEFKPPPPPPPRGRTETKEKLHRDRQQDQKNIDDSYSVAIPRQQQQQDRETTKDRIIQNIEETKESKRILQSSSTTGTLRAPPLERASASALQTMHMNIAQTTKQKEGQPDNHYQHQSESSTDQRQRQNEYQRQYKEHDMQPNYYHHASNSRSDSQQQQPPRQQQANGYAQKRHQQQGLRTVRSSFGEAQSSSVTSAFKGLWGKVEQTLDDLANLEDTVAGRAQRLVNTAITTASTASKISPSTIRSLAQSGAAARATVASRGNRNTPFTRRKNASPSIADTTSVPLKPYGQKFQIAIEEKEQRQKEQMQQVSPSAVYDVGNGDKSRSISTKGGATSSPYHPPQQPSPPSSSSLPTGDHDGRTVDKVVPSAETEDSLNRNANANANVNEHQRTNSYNPSPSSWESRPLIPQADRGIVGPPSETTASTPRVGERPFVPPNANANSVPFDGNRNRSRIPGNYANSGNGMNNRQTRDASQANGQQQNSHSRSSRIPWDTSASSKQPNSPPSRFVQSTPNQAVLAHRYDDHDVPVWKRTLKKLVPPLPSIPNLGKLIPMFRRGSKEYSYATLDAWDAAYNEESDGPGFFGFFKKKSKSGFSSRSSSSSLFRQDRHDKNDDQSPLITSMLSRCDNGKNTSLLRETDLRASHVIGRYKAILDILCLVSVLMGFKLVPGIEDLTSLPISFEEVISVTLSKGGSILNELLMGSWAFFAFLYAYLFKYTQERILNKKTDSLASSVASSVKEESEYAQLYLRLTTATPMNRNLPDRLAAISKYQVASVVANARLNSFVWIVLASLTFMTVSAVGPILMAFTSTFTDIAMLQELRQWPVQWQNIFSASSILIQNLFRTLESHSTRAISTFVEKPMQFSFHLSMFGSLLICNLLPRLEERRALASKRDEDQDLEEDDAVSSSFESAEEWSRLGTSSASRLSMLSENGSVENALARWRASHVTTLEESASYGPALSSLLRLIAYTLVAALLAGLPVAVSHFLAGETSSWSNAISIFRWDSLFDVSFMQLFLFALVHQTLQKVMESVNDASVVKNFQADLVSTKHEIEESNKINAQVMASISPSAGISVRDLWAAHATKRAWAVRGANLQCKNGEILAILGEDGNGKTRLLTTLAEALTFPPKRTTTTNKVRGFISVGGLEISKWNRKMLKRRLGVLLSDVRVIADSASLFSGWTMEEILEPIDGVRSSNNDSLQRTYTSAEKSAMLLALKLTGLYRTLLAKLPSKTSTIFTANEEDLRPTSLKPRSAVLSPGEWSKLILARVLSQTIYDNDNALASNDKIENSLVGSTLLLDEPTTMHSEADEGQLFRDLRLTGAATVITSNKWATGRFADQICVMKNGLIVEMGNHNELLARGPQQSLYAAKWHAMTMQ